MRRLDGVGGFVGLVAVIALLYGLSPTIFQSVSYLQLLGPLALLFGGLGMYELVNRGDSFEEALGKIVFVGVLAAVLVGGPMWYVTHMPIQIFPGQITPAHSGSSSSYLPNIFR